MSDHPAPCRLAAMPQSCGQPGGRGTGPCMGTGPPLQASLTPPAQFAGPKPPGLPSARLLPVCSPREALAAPEARPARDRPAWRCSGSLGKGRKERGSAAHKMAAGHLELRTRAGSDAPLRGRKGRADGGRAYAEGCSARARGAQGQRAELRIAGRGVAMAAGAAPRPRPSRRPYILTCPRLAPPGVPAPSVPPPLLLALLRHPSPQIFQPWGRSTCPLHSPGSPLVSPTIRF